MKTNEALALVETFAKNEKLGLLEAMMALKRLNQRDMLDDELKTAFLVAFDGFSKLLAPRN